MSIGTAKPIPTLPLLVPPVAICVLIPMTSPAASISGPPELPGLIAASVWITSVIRKPLTSAGIWRCLAETTPVVSVRSRPKGLPIATTGSPTCDVRGRAPSFSGLRPRPFGVDLQHREVGRAIAAEDLGLDLLVVLELDGDLGGVVDHVGVGEDRPVGVDHEARARRLARWGVTPPSGVVAVRRDLGLRTYTTPGASRT